MLPLSEIGRSHLGNLGSIPYHGVLRDFVDLTVHQFDVVVVGAGSAGMIAAYAAARTGARTCLVEGTGIVGGTTFALGNVVSFHNNRMEPVVAGFPQLIVDQTIEAGGARPGGHIRNPGGMCGTVTLLDPEILRFVMTELLEEAGVELLLHTSLVDAIMRDRRIVGIRILNKSGLQDIYAQVIVDCTGDADVAAKAEAAYEQDAPGKSLSATLLFRVAGVDSSRFVEDLKRYPDKMVLLEDPYLREKQALDSREVIVNEVKSIFDLPYVYLTNLVRDYIPKKDWPDWGVIGIEKAEWGRLKPFGSRVHFSPSPLRSDILYVNTTNLHIDASDGAQRSRAEVEGLRQVRLMLDILRRYIPGFESSYLLNIMPAISVRASRRIIGRYRLTRADVENGVRFPDSIARGCYPMSVQSETEPNVRYHLYVKDGKDYDIPYRCLIPEEIDGLLVAGRCLSATREASGSARCGAQCMALGQAAGTAAALSVEQGLLPGTLDFQILRQRLIAQRAIV